MINSSLRCGRALAVLALLSPGLVFAADSTTSTAKPSPPKPVIYRPAKGSAPEARVTGGSRGSGDSTITLDVLAPDETALTTHEQPSLFWYQSKPAKARLELTLVQADTIKPLLQFNVERAADAGIQRIRLTDQKVKLAVGVEYKWVIALVTDPDNRSSDLVASGFIKRIEASEELKRKLASASPESRPTIYGEAGIWCDALTSLSDLVDSQPENKTARAQRADLLRQVGLKAAAAAEARAAQN